MFMATSVWSTMEVLTNKWSIGNECIRAPAERAQHFYPDNHTSSKVMNQTSLREFSQKCYSNYPTPTKCLWQHQYGGPEQYCHISQFLVNSHLILSLSKLLLTGEKKSKVSKPSPRVGDIIIICFPGPRFCWTPTRDALRIFAAFKHFLDAHLLEEVSETKWKRRGHMVQVNYFFRNFG